MLVSGEAPIDLWAHVRLTEEMLEDFFLGTCRFSEKEDKDTSQACFHHHGEKNNSLVVS